MIMTPISVTDVQFVLAEDILPKTATTVSVTSVRRRGIPSMNAQLLNAPSVDNSGTLLTLAGLIKFVRRATKSAILPRFATTATSSVRAVGRLDTPEQSANIKLTIARYVETKVISR